MFTSIHYVMLVIKLCIIYLKYNICAICSNQTTSKCILIKLLQVNKNACFLTTCVQLCLILFLNVIGTVSVYCFSMH